MIWLTKLWRALVAYRKGVGVRRAYQVGDTVYMHPDDYAKLMASRAGMESVGGLKVVSHPLVCPEWMVGRRAFMHVWRGHA